MPRGSGPLTRALVVAVLLASTTACVPFGTDANPTKTHPAPITSAPAATPTASPSSSAPSPTAAAQRALGPLPDGVAPARPAALDQPPTLEGAKAVAIYYLLLFSYAYQANDLSAWNALSHADCSFCADVRSDVEKQAARGSHVAGGNVEVRSVRGTEVTIGRFFNVQATIHESGSRTVDPTGALRDDLGAGATAIDMVVLFENGSWSIRAVDHKPTTE